MSLDPRIPPPRTARPVLLPALVALFSGVLALNAYLQWRKTPAAGGRAVRTAADFRLTGHDDKSYELYRQADARAVVLVSAGVGCPILRQSVPTFKALARRYAAQGIVFWMLDANPQDTPEDVAAMASEFDLGVPVLLDPSQAVARSLELSVAGEALLIDPRNWGIVYRGPIDERWDFGARKAWLPEDNGLSRALAQFARGREVIPDSLPVKGCAITWENAPDTSYIGGAAPILKSKCLACHLSNSPISLAGYEQVKGWSSMIRRSVLTLRMPPWQAEGRYGRFVDDLSLSPSQVRALIGWIDAGAQRGEGPDPLLEADRRERARNGRDWPLGPPDVVFSADKEQSLPASGTIPYVYARAGSAPARDLRIRAYALRSNIRVVHHLELWAVPESQAGRPMEMPGAPGFKESDREVVLFARPGPPQARYVPTGTTIVFPAGRVPILQLHYEPSGKPERDRSQIGLYLYKTPARPKRLLTDSLSYGGPLTIPAGAKDFPVRAEKTFPRAMVLRALVPHMHLRGKSMRFDAGYPNGKKETLLLVSHWDWNWQKKYYLREPKLLPAGTRIRLSGVFDNSAQNPANPAPGRAARFGPHLTDEMFVGWIQYTTP